MVSLTRTTLAQQQPRRLLLYAIEVDGALVLARTGNHDQLL
ncbi:MULTISPECIES: type II toxin-antitoxin system YafQ family toxin [Actinomyces]|nr:MULTISPECIES: type II toxin-antitoxin system YafQ family toxin [Actinomyces]